MAVYGNMIEPILNESMVLKDIHNIITESERNFDIVTEANIAEIVEKVVDKILVFIQKCIATIKQAIAKAVGKKYANFWKKYDFKNFKYSEENNEKIHNFIYDSAKMFKINEQILRIYEIEEYQVILTHDIPSNLQEEISYFTTKASSTDFSNKSMNDRDYWANYDCFEDVLNRIMERRVGTRLEDFYTDYYTNISSSKNQDIINILEAKYLKEAYMSMNNIKGIMSSKRYINYVTKRWFNTIHKSSEDESKYFSNDESKDTSESGYSVFVNQIVGLLRFLTYESITQYKFMIKYTSLLMKLSNI